MNYRIMFCATVQTGDAYDSRGGSSNELLSHGFDAIDDGDAMTKAESEWAKVKSKHSDALFIEFEKSPVNFGWRPKEQ